MNTAKAYILFVDDDKEVLKTLQVQVGESELAQHFAFEYAQSYEELLQLIDEIENDGEEIAVVVSDQIMPGVKGSELLSQLHVRYPEIKKIMLSGLASNDDIIRTLNEAQLFRFIEKPWDQPQLVDALAQAARLYESEKERLNEGLSRDTVRLLAYHLLQVNNTEAFLETFCLHSSHIFAIQFASLLMYENEEGQQPHLHFHSWSHEEGLVSSERHSASLHRPSDFLPLFFIEELIKKVERIKILDEPLDNYKTPSYVRNPGLPQPRTICVLPFLSSGVVGAVLYLELGFEKKRISDEDCEFLNLLLSLNWERIHQRSRIDVLEKERDEKAVLMQQEIDAKSEVLASTLRLADEQKRMITPSVAHLKPYCSDIQLIAYAGKFDSRYFYWFTQQENGFRLVCGRASGNGPEATLLACQILWCLNNGPYDSSDRETQTADQLMAMVFRFLVRKKTDDEDRSTNPDELALCVIDVDLGGMIYRHTSVGQAVFIGSTQHGLHFCEAGAKISLHDAMHDQEFVVNTGTIDSDTSIWFVSEPLYSFFEEVEVDKKHTFRQLFQCAEQQARILRFSDQGETLLLALLLKKSEVA